MSLVPSWSLIWSSPGGVTLASVADGEISLSTYQGKAPGAPTKIPLPEKGHWQPLAGVSIADGAALLMAGPQRQGDDSHDPPRALGLSRLQPDKDAMTLGDPVVLPMMSTYEASQARDAIKAGHQAAVKDDFALCPSLDAAGKPDSALWLAWIEVIPPPAGSLRFDVRERRAAEWGAHSCGVHSRSLTDGSVKKKVHLSKLSVAGVVLSDQADPLPTSNSLPTLTLTPAPGRPILGGLARPQAARPGTEGPASPPAAALRMPGVQTLLAAGYDRRAGEGVLVVRENDRSLLYTIDSQGKSTGEPALLKASRSFSAARALRVGSRWLALTESGAVVVLRGSGPARVPELAVEKDVMLPPSFLSSEMPFPAPLLAAGEDGRLEIWTQTCTRGDYGQVFCSPDASLFHAVIHPDTLRAEPLRQVAGWPPPEGRVSFRQVHHVELLAQGTYRLHGETTDDRFVAVSVSSKGIWGEIALDEEAMPENRAGAPWRVFFTGPGAWLGVDYQLKPGPDSVITRLLTPPPASSSSASSAPPSAASSAPPSAASSSPPSAASSAPPPVAQP
jgi:hypothetical protein